MYNLTMNNTKPLEGYVVDLTHMLSGPYGSMILADLGCETIKVEPFKGELLKITRKSPDYSFNGTGAYFYTLNKIKKAFVQIKKP